MSQGDVIGIIQNAVYAVLAASAPMLVIAVVVGLIVSIFQATTQINEQTLAFVLKIVCIFAALVLFGGYIMTTLNDFTVGMYESIGTFIK